MEVFGSERLLRRRAPTPASPGPLHLAVQLLRLVPRTVGPFVRMGPDPGRGIRQPPGQEPVVDEPPDELAGGPDRSPSWSRRRRPPATWRCHRGTGSSPLLRVVGGGARRIEDLGVDAQRVDELGERGLVLRVVEPGGHACPGLRAGQRRGPRGRPVASPTYGSLGFSVFADN